jgi:hypothetical protein
MRFVLSPSNSFLDLFVGANKEGNFGVFAFVSPAGAKKYRVESIRRSCTLCSFQCIVFGDLWRRIEWARARVVINLLLKNSSGEGYGYGGKIK